MKNVSVSKTIQTTPEPMAKTPAETCEEGDKRRVVTIDAEDVNRTQEVNREVAKKGSELRRKGTDQCREAKSAHSHHHLCRTPAELNAE